MSQRIIFLALGLLAQISAVAGGRTWTDSTGNYHLDADLIAFNDTAVTLEKENHQLVAVPIDKLSQDDQAYLQSKDVAEHSRQSAAAMQTWTMASGLKVMGKVVDYAPRRRHPATPR